jgi:Methyltransferase domain
MNDRAIRELLSSFPRERAPLTVAHEVRYVEEYTANRSGRGVLFSATAALESWMHRKVAAKANKGSILELGAGTLNHVPFEPFTKHYDVVEPFRSFWQESPYRSRIDSFYDDICQVPEQRRYDRIIGIAVLEHLVDLPYVVARCGTLLAPEGRFQIGIPTEGGALWGLAWRCTTGIAYRLRTGLNYANIMRHEHVNNANEIVLVLRHFFGELKLRRFPLPTYHLSFYTCIDAGRVQRERCLEFIRVRDEAKLS